MTDFVSTWRMFFSTNVWVIAGKVKTSGTDRPENILTAFQGQILELYYVMLGIHNLPGTDIMIFKIFWEKRNFFSPKIVKIVKNRRKLWS
jgi:hypothetical protein